MKASVEEMYERASRDQKEEKLGVMNLFSLIEEEEKPFSSPPPVINPSTSLQLFQKEKELLGFYLTGHPMDGYKKILGKLSCVPLAEVHLLPDGTIFRAAFVVDSLQVKVSSKNQKKFAILIISDGLERFELPVWSEIFEEKGALLRENQLLYGILQVDRKSGNLQLSCKYLDDLTTVDEESVKTCDQICDKLKSISRASEGKWKKDKPTEKKEKEIEKEKILKINLHLDADVARLSQILELKELFLSHPGKSTIELHFKANEKKLGSVFIDEQWGVSGEKEFLDKLKELASKFKIKIAGSTGKG